MSWSSKDFCTQWNNPSPAREAAIVNEVIKGNVPSWQWKLVPVTLLGQVVMVTPDYLSIGTDSDFFRAPLTNYAAQYLATKLGYELPTTRLVDKIWQQAATRLKPITPNWNYVPPITGSNLLRALDHSQMIARETSFTPATFMAGHKKDVVSDISLLKARPHHVVIYGWQDQAGHNIQPETSVHGDFFSDYSHGVRFVKPSPGLSGPCDLSSAPIEFLKEVSK